MKSYLASKGIAAIAGGSCLPEKGTMWTIQPVSTKSLPIRAEAPADVYTRFDEETGRISMRFNNYHVRPNSPAPPINESGLPDSDEESIHSDNRPREINHAYVGWVETDFEIAARVHMKAYHEEQERLRQHQESIRRFHEEQQKKKEEYMSDGWSS